MKLKQTLIRLTIFLSAVLTMGTAQSKQPMVAATSAQLEANKKLVLDFWRVVIEAHDLDAADQYCATDFIQHNPLMSNGIASMIERFKVLAKGESRRPIAPTLRNPPAAVMAEGDLVLLMWQRPTPEPSNPASSYDRYTFDLYRVENRKIVEHWDAAIKPVP